MVYDYDLENNWFSLIRNIVVEFVPGVTKLKSLQKINNLGVVGGFVFESSEEPTYTNV